jgi:hypothetical protein
MPEFPSFWNWLGWTVLILGGLEIVAQAVIAIAIQRRTK